MRIRSTRRRTIASSIAQRDEGAFHAHKLVLEVLERNRHRSVCCSGSSARIARFAPGGVPCAKRAQRAFAPGLALAVMCFPLNTHLAFYSAGWGLLFWWLLALYCAALFANDARCRAAASTMPREPLSVVVTTFNNAATLERCLASVAWADDIVVLDSGSTDATLEIAAKYKARIFSEPFKGYAAQKQSAIDKAAHDWVLLLDADEALTEAARGGRSKRAERIRTWPAFVCRGANRCSGHSSTR